MDKQMDRPMDKINVLMCCSDLSYKGGMVSVVKGYLGYKGWPDDINITFVPTHREAGKAGLLVYFARAVARIVWLCARGKVDVAHLHVAERGSFMRKGFLVRLLYRFGIPVALHHHGAEFEDYYEKSSPEARRRIDSVLAEADVNLVLSRRLVPMILSKAPEARVEVLYNAVGVPETNPYSTSSRGVLFLGRLGERKGTYVLLDAIRRLDPELPPDITFALCGDGETDLVAEKVGEMGLGHRISHIGWTDGPEKERFMAGAMMNVLPSFNEGLPMTILETMARGIPNISTPVASIPEVIHEGETGLLVPPGDAEALAEAIRRLATDPGLRQKISRESHALVCKDFDIHGRVAALTALYRRLARKS